MTSDNRWSNYKTEYNPDSSDIYTDFKAISPENSSTSMPLPSTPRHERYIDNDYSEKTREPERRVSSCALAIRGIVGVILTFGGGFLGGYVIGMSAHSTCLTTTTSTNTTTILNNTTTPATTTSASVTITSASVTITSASVTITTPMTTTMQTVLTGGLEARIGSGAVGLHGDNAA
ncbi:unnamed protein product [Owenia fusiformis]|uniref:Uncharacterized protein n=1 Tax=Owenia fusiformis TaxID=6347 RepID=A0A8S4P2T2_OWEFU|nr:unnamed protein product [Owenia fusiformis]